MTKSILKILAVTTSIFSASWVAAETAASLPAECKVTTPAIETPSVRDLTQMTCRYECAERVRTEFGLTISAIPDGVSCLWDGVDKTREFLIDQNVLVEPVADPGPETPEPVVAAPVNGRRTSLVSPYRYSNKPKNESRRTLASAEKAANKDGKLNAAETKELNKLEKIDHSLDVAKRTNAMEKSIEAFEGKPGYDELVKHLKTVQQLEQVLARDRMMDEKEAKRLNGRLLRLEARVAIASGEGLNEKRAVVLEAFKNVRKAKLLEDSEISEVKSKLDAFNTARSAALASDGEINDTERLELIASLNEILAYIRDRRDANTSVEDFLLKAQNRINRSLNDDIISEAQSKKLNKKLLSASRKGDKSESLKAMRKIVNVDLIAEAADYVGDGKKWRKNAKNKSATSDEGVKKTGGRALGKKADGAASSARKPATSQTKKQGGRAGVSK